MPARQDQTLQIFLIISIFFSLVCAVLGFLAWRAYSEEAQRYVALENDNRSKQTSIGNLTAENEGFREMIGFGANDNAADIKTAFDEEMKTRGAGVADEGSRNYRKVSETLYADVQRLAASEASLKEQVKDLNNRLSAVQTEANNQISQFEQQRQEAEANLASERNTFTEDRKKLESVQKDLMATVEKQSTEHEAELAKNAADKAELDKKIAELERAVTLFSEQRKDEPGSFEVADGRISWVNQNGTVWINLGALDSLRRQVTFSVYDADEHDAEKAEKKGSIEVTRILGEHMAEARITEDDSTNPILTGDRIYSQVWQPGKKLHFALTGLIDVDGDTRSDMQLARELIELNGGVVDAYVTDDGSIEGTIEATTRYLVLGDLPTSVTQAKAQESWTTMNQTADSLGVETITLSQFLSQMGYKPQDRAVTLGAGASARDFPARPDDGSTRPNSAGRFRPRTPYRATPTATPTPR
jgi:hypothetical protein